MIRDACGNKNDMARTNYLFCGGRKSCTTTLYALSIPRLSIMHGIVSLVRVPPSTAVCNEHSRMPSPFLLLLHFLLFRQTSKPLQVLLSISLMISPLVVSSRALLVNCSCRARKRSNKRRRDTRRGSSQNFKLPASLLKKLWATQTAKALRARLTPARRW